MTASVTRPASAPQAAHRWWVIVSTALSVALLLSVVAVAAVYWPARFGGSHTVVRVSGQSMEPTLRNGDIVIVRALDEYALGDVIVYPGRDETGEVRGYVIHRIVAGDAVNGYVTRGDNRTSDDPWRPTPADIDGRVVRTLAAGSVAGSVVSVLTQPLGLALIAAGLVFIAVWRLTARQAAGDVGAAPRRRRRAPQHGVPYGWVPAPSLPAAPAAPETVGEPPGPGLPVPAPLVPVDLAALVRVVEAAADTAAVADDAAATHGATAASVVAAITERLPVVTVAQAPPTETDLWAVLRAQTASLDELEVRWSGASGVEDASAVPVG